jgi:hypothetical protein
MEGQEVERKTVWSVSIDEQIKIQQPLKFAPKWIKKR